ncbi:hypothetical protein [Dictyobacter formicarum]|uniref:Lipoprotein n=1 Tax=Dictyobacter formicarum TaxID=2778368 RepID=A0ABQ3VR10_9CHLR|nr:hypothetical protein [Dictyobacter formicarum]GHO88028.1 hypothetical protein KSZ_60340 [Dictyobacter formicarum]
MPKLQYKALLILCFFLLSACGNQGPSSPALPPEGYLSTSQSPNGNFASYIQYTEHNGQWVGNIQEAVLPSVDNPSVSTGKVTFTGVHNGNSISLTITDINAPISNISGTLTGTFSESTITLNLSESDGSIKSFVYKGASINQYNQAISNLKKLAQKADEKYREQTAVTQANNTMNTDIGTLSGDEATLKSISFDSDLQALSQDNQTIQQDYQQEQTDANTSCTGVGAGQVQVDYAQVQVGISQMQTDVNTTRSDKAQYEKESKAVQDDKNTIKNDWVQLQQAVKNNSYKDPKPLYTQSDVDSFIQGAQTILDNAAKNWNNARGAGNTYLAQANSTAKSAYILSTHCQP